MASGSNELILHPVWRRLPVELMEDVLTRVPFESLTCFRAVCKRFNSLVTSPKFARECQRQQAWKPVPMIVRKSIPMDSCLVDVFNTKTNSWVTSPLPVLEARLFPLKLCAVSRGLLCFDTKDFRKFVVCNPLTRAFSLLELPNPPDGDDAFSFCSHRAITGLVVDLQKGTFMLVLVTSNEIEGEGKTVLYDSADGSWRSGAPLPFVGYVIHTLTDTRRIYVLLEKISSYKDTYYKGYKLLKYNVRDDSWSQSWMPLSASQLKQPKIFFVEREAATSKERLAFRALHGKLETLCKRWIKNTGDVVTTGLGYVNCITRCTHPGYPMQVLHFNCITGEFSFLPDCLTTKTGNWSRDEFEFKLLEPSLTVDL